MSSLKTAGLFCRVITIVRGSGHLYSSKMSFSWFLGSLKSTMRRSTTVQHTKLHFKLSKKGSKLQRMQELCSFRDAFVLFVYKVLSFISDCLNVLECSVAKILSFKVSLFMISEVAEFLSFSVSV